MRLIPSQWSRRPAGDGAECWEAGGRRPAEPEAAAARALEKARSVGKQTAPAALLAAVYAEHRTTHADDSRNRPEAGGASASAHVRVRHGLRRPLRLGAPPRAGLVGYPAPLLPLFRCFAAGVLLFSNPRLSIIPEFGSGLICRQVSGTCTSPAKKRELEMLGINASVFDATESKYVLLLLVLSPFHSRSCI